MNTIKRDQELINHIVKKYGKSDVVKYVNKINEGFLFKDFFGELNDTAFKQESDEHSYTEENTKPKIEKWLNENGITNYDFYYDFSIIVNQDVDFSGKGWSGFPEYINFKTVKGNFSIANNNFESTEQLPNEIIGEKLPDGKRKPVKFDLSGNKFKEIFPFMTTVKCTGYIDLTNNPELVMHYEYVRKNGQIICDDDQYSRFIEEKMKGN